MPFNGNVSLQWKSHYPHSECFERENWGVSVTDLKWTLKIEIDNKNVQLPSSRIFHSRTPN